MIPTSDLALFVTTSILLILAPGPDILFLISQSATYGPRAGFVTAMGLAAGNLVHTCAAALGLSVVFRASPIAFNILKIAGVAYLLFLAWKAVRGPTRKSETADAGERSADTGERSADTGRAGTFWRGFLMNVLNPKVALFFLAFLPQFTSPKVGPIWAQMLMLGAIFIALVVVVFGMIGITAGAASRRLTWVFGGSGAGKARWVVACVYAGLAVRLALVAR